MKADKLKINQIIEKRSKNGYTMDFDNILDLVEDGKLDMYARYITFRYKSPEEKDNITTYLSERPIFGTLKDVAIKGRNIDFIRRQKDTGKDYFQLAGVDLSDDSSLELSKKLLTDINVWLNVLKLQLVEKNENNSEIGIITQLINDLEKEDQEFLPCYETEKGEVCFSLHAEYLSDPENFSTVYFYEKDDSVLEQNNGRPTEWTSEEKKEFVLAVNELRKTEKNGKKINVEHACENLAKEGRFPTHTLNKSSYYAFKKGFAEK